MTRTEAQNIANAKLAKIGPEAGIIAYTALREATFKTRDRETAQAMVFCGNALELLIGEAAFDALMDKIDEA